MRLCILNSLTKVCENVVVADNEQSFVPYKEGIEVAPNHDGNIGWRWDSVNNTWINPSIVTPSVSELASIVRTKRNNLLKQSVDRINPLRWESYTQAQKDAWIAYRQALLDVPAQQNFPYDIIWPNKPE